MLTSIKSFIGKWYINIKQNPTGKSTDIITDKYKLYNLVKLVQFLYRAEKQLSSFEVPQHIARRFGILHYLAINVNLSIITTVCKKSSIHNYMNLTSCRHPSQQHATFRESEHCLTLLGTSPVDVVLFKLLFQCIIWYW